MAVTAPSQARQRKPKPPQEIVKTWAFDSVGNRKYAFQIKKASNGNPCLLFVEGVPQPDGTFRKFNITVWSEDFAKLFSMIDEVRNFMAEHNIKTPDGHKYDPNKPRGKWSGGGGRGRGGNGGSRGGSGGNGGGRRENAPAAPRQRPMQPPAILAA